MENIKTVIGKNIQVLRKKYNLTQLELGNKLNYTAKAVSKWERGESIPELETLMAIAEIFNVTVDALLHEIDVSKMKDYLREDVKDKNKMFVYAMAITIVWLLAAIIFAYKVQFLEVFDYNLFTWSLPISIFIVCVGIRNKSKKVRMIFLSILLWVTLAVVFFQFIYYNMYLLFIIGIPAQIALLLWSKIIIIK